MSLKIKHAYLILALGLILLFQNCGSDYEVSSLYADDGSGGMYSEDCISAVVDCGPKSEYLLVSIDTQDPLIISSSSGNYTISGRCNTGNYPGHYITYEVTNSVGTRVVKQILQEICISGRYQFNLPLSAVSAGENHSLVVTISGVDDEGFSVTSTQSGGSDRIDFFEQ